MLRILRATADYREAAVGLLQAQFDEHQISLSPDRRDAGVSGMIANPDRGTLLLAIEDEQPVGVAALAYTWTLEHGGRVAWLDELYVVPLCRERGLGTALLKAAEDVARAAGCAAIELEVEATHRRAQHLYQRAGFEPRHRSRWVLAFNGSASSASAEHRPFPSLDHISLGVNDLARAKTFYDAALAPLGLVPRVQIPGEVAYGPANGNPNPDEGFAFYIGFEDAAAKRRVTPSAGSHVALRAPTREAVRRFHQAALDAGGRDNGRPGLRPHYHANYYGAFVLDPDGHHIEAVCHEPETDHQR